MGTTDSNGNLLYDERYLPYGGIRLNNDMVTDFAFTGQRNLAKAGLMDYNARWYSPTVGAFTQPDSIVPDPMDPQSFNRYAYVQSNPLRYTDPSGHAICADEECAFVFHPVSNRLIQRRPISQAGTNSSSPLMGGRGGAGADPTYNCRRNPNAPSCGAYLSSQAETQAESPAGVCRNNGGNHELCLLVMPSNASPSIGIQDDVLFGSGVLTVVADWTESAVTGLGRAFVHSGIEGAEAIGSAIPPIAIAASGLDVGITATGCYNAGECYINSPGYGLPEMLVIDQDLAVTLSDLVIGTVGYLGSGPIADFGTSVASLAYDNASIAGVIPNYVSVGLTRSTIYIMIYP